MTNFTATKALFHLPDDIIYLDGNSLGPLPRTAIKRVESMMRDEWGEYLIRGWNQAGWMDQPLRIGDRIARLIGAAAGTVMMGDTLSIKVYQALGAALQLNPNRRIVLSDKGNFPSDLYMAQGLIRSLDREYELKLSEPEAIEDNLSEDIAVLMLTEVDYRTGRKHDMQALTARAHELGIVTVWDLAHSAGALPVDVTTADADFAVGCTYKYLNSGPGGPAFIYVAPRLVDQVQPALAGWLGHAQPFDFDLDYQPGEGIERMRVGTPPVIQLAALEASLDIWDTIDMQSLRSKSIELSDLFIEQIETNCPELVLASPRDGKQRGSQVSFRFDNGYAAMQAIIARGVIGDFRSPDIMRFGFTPLYIDEEDVLGATAIISEVMNKRLWDQAEYFIQARVT
jgi:kynureninase